jgi:hypothetical protein
MPDAARETADAALASDAAPMSFSRDVAPLLDHCGNMDCHGPGTTWPYASLVSAAATECDPARVIVTPGDVAHSYLIDKLSGHDMCTGVQMPKMGTPLAQDQVDAIASWIAQGAANN